MLTDACQYKNDILELSCICLRPLTSPVECDSPSQTLGRGGVPLWFLLLQLFKVTNPDLAQALSESCGAGVCVCLARHLCAPHHVLPHRFALNFDPTFSLFSVIELRARI